MPVKQRLKKIALQTATNTLVASGQLQKMAKVLQNSSEKERIRWLRWLAGVAGNLVPFAEKSGNYQEKLLWLADWMERPGNNASAILERILNLNPNSRDKFLINLVTRGTILGAVHREEIFQQRGFAPFFVVISPSMKCNLNCVNCYAWHYEKAPVLSFEVLSSVCSQMEKAGCGFITITGGEPYLYRDPQTAETIWDLFEAHPNIFFQTYTNGTFLADEQNVARMLTLGNVVPAISVEGFEQETAERRGQETWDKIMQAMRLMREAKLPFGFSATVTRHNVDKITTDRFIDFWIEQGCLFGWTFILIPIGAGDIEMMLLPEQRDRLREFTTIYVRKTKPILWFDFWNDGCIVDGCIAGGRHCHILHDGRVAACVFSPFVPRGFNVKDQPLLDILEEASYFRKVRGYIEERRRNPLLPCMVIDKPHHLKRAVEEGDAEAAYPGAEQLLQITEILEQKAVPYRAIAEIRLKEKYPWAIERLQK